MTHSKEALPQLGTACGTRRGLLCGAAGLAGGLLLRNPSLTFASRGQTAQSSHGVWQNGYAWVANHGLSGDDYQSAFDQLGGQGYRLRNVCGYTVNGQDLYASIWDQSPGPAWVGMHRMSGSDYQAQFDQLTGQGYRPIDISGYEMNGTDAYAAIFEQSDANGWTAHHGVAGADYQALFDQNVANGLRPVRVSGYTVGGSDYVASIWIGDDGSGWSAIHGADNATYQDQFNQATANGMWLSDISGYEWNGSDTYTAIFDYNTSPFWIAHNDMSADAYQNAFDENGAAGYTLVHVAGYGVQGEARYAAIWADQNEPTGGTVGRDAVDKIANDAIAAANVPGVSVAIAVNGRLVYAKAYGTADKSTGEAMTVNSRLRIASLSKPITSAAIFQLEEQGTLTRSDFVFGDNGWLGNDYGTKAYPANLTAITIDHLLTHTSGGWGTNDPMFQHTEMDHDALITWAIDTYPPMNTPGSAYAYANFNYCLLGRIIERATGMAYDSWVAGNTLAQCGITDMQIAGDSLADRAADEVVYDKTNSTYGDPYGIPVHRMDSHGGWIATATDLLRFLVRVDGLADPADVISGDSWTAMTTGTTANSTYGRGWGVAGGGEMDHTGRLGGTESILVKQADGVCYAVIANGNGIDPGQVGHDMAYAVADWGTGTAL